MKPYPSMSGLGWVKDPATALPLLMADYFTSLRSQTSLFRGNISSLPGDLQAGKASASVMANTIQASLRMLMGAYFDETDISVDTEPIEGSEFTKLKIYVTVTDGGFTYGIERSAKIADGLFEELLQQINQ